MVNITKKMVEKSVRDYIDRGLSPSNQAEPRSSNFFDIRGITQEFYETLKTSARELSHIEVDTIVRKALRLAERNANKFKRGKIIEEDVASAFEGLAIPTDSFL